MILYCRQVISAQDIKVVSDVLSSPHLAQSILIHVHYMPLHLQSYYQKLGFNYGDFPQAELYYQQSFTLPLHPNLTTQQQLLIINALLHFD